MLNNCLKKCLFSALGLLIFTTTYSQVNINFSCNKSIVEKGESVQLILKSNYSGNLSLTYPYSYKELGYNQKAEQVFDHQRGARVTQYSVLLTGEFFENGEYVIQGSYKANGKKYKTEPIVIKVVDDAEDYISRMSSSVDVVE